MLWRIKRNVAVAIAAAFVLSLLSVATSRAWCDGGWCYNAVVDVEGTEIATLWMVNGGTNLDEQFDYKAAITVGVPKDASASVVKQAATETVRIKESDDLACGSNSVQVEASWHVSSISPGTDPNATVTVELWNWTAMVMLDAVTGRLNQNLKLAGEIPVVNPSCAGGG